MKWQTRKNTVQEQFKIHSLQCMLRKAKACCLSPREERNLGNKGRHRGHWHTTYGKLSRPAAAISTGSLFRFLLGNKVKAPLQSKISQSARLCRVRTWTSSKRSKSCVRLYNLEMQFKSLIRFLKKASTVHPKQAKSLAKGGLAS